MNFDIKQKTILFLGSTSAFGWGVEYNKSYSYLIAEHLKSKKIIITQLTGQSQDNYLVCNCVGS